MTSPPPTAAYPVCLLLASDVWGHAFRAFGFPGGYDDGVWASGILRGKTAAGWFQLEDIKGAGYRVQPGFSGGPVWDEQLNGVVGMAVAAALEAETKAAFMTPTSLLLKAWPELTSVTLDVNDLAYLQEQLVMLEAAQQAAPDPHRFKVRIEDLRTAVANWEGRIQQQQQRIVQGLAEQRQQIALVSQQQGTSKRVSVVGRYPLGTVEYFKNRRRELETVGRLLAEPTTRLVSIIGHGGMGKTALAGKVLQDLERHHWPHTDQDIPVDGLAYLSTRTAGISLERLFLDCAKMLGEEAEKRLNAVWTNPGLNTEDKVSHLLEALKEGLYVILLDNLEDLLDDQGQWVDQDLRLFFDRSLVTGHGARLLVTSRLALTFKREVLRFDQQVKLLEGLPIEDGVALLRELDPNGDYGLRDAPAEQLAQAVSLVHGVPRALEVIVGLLANDPFASLVEVLERFYQHPDVVQALIEENYKRLDQNARRVIEALAVLKRPAPPLAVDYLLAPFTPGLDVPAIIRRLTLTNVVSVDRTTKTVTLHPIDQDYAYSQLPEEGIGESIYTRQALERRAANYYAQLRTPTNTWKTIDDLAPQLAEFEHRVRAGDYDEACQLLDLIDNDYLFLWGYYGRLANMREKLLGQLKDHNLQANNISRLGRVYNTLRDIKQAIRFYEQALDIAHKIDDHQQKEVLLGYLGSAYRDLGQVELAIEFYRQSLDIAREIGNRQEEGSRIGRLGRAYGALGHFDKAIELYLEALEIAREVRDRKEEGIRFGLIGSAYYDLGQFQQAIEFYEQALTIAYEINHRQGQAHRLLGLGKVRLTIGEVTEASRLCKEALLLNMPETNHLAAFILGCVFLQQDVPNAQSVFTEAAIHCRDILDKTPDMYDPHYILAAVLVGQAVCDPRWAEEDMRADLLTPALAEYRQALEICDAPGIVQDAFRDLDLIRKAGVEGLEPVFALLQSGAKK